MRKSLLAEITTAKLIVVGNEIIGKQIQTQKFLHNKKDAAEEVDAVRKWQARSKNSSHVKILNLLLSFLIC